MATEKQLVREAASLEASAKDNLAAWALLGQSSKYSERMDRAANLRRAAELKGAERNEFMRNKGIS